MAVKLTLWCPGSRLEVFDRAGHFPYLDQPERGSVATLEDWRHDRAHPA